MIPNVKNVPYFRPYSNKPIDLHYLIAASLLPLLYDYSNEPNTWSFVQPDQGPKSYGMRSY